MGRMRRPVAVLAAAVLSWTASAAAAMGQGDEQAEAPVPLEQQWEDGLLLDALRHLRLVPQQLQGLLPLSAGADARLDRLRARQDRTLASLVHLTARHRGLLLSGRRVPGTEEEPGPDADEVLRA